MTSSRTIGSSAQKFHSHWLPSGISWNFKYFNQISRNFTKFQRINFTCTHKNPHAHARTHPRTHARTRTLEPRHLWAHRNPRPHAGMDVRRHARGQVRAHALMHDFMQFLESKCRQFYGFMQFLESKCGQFHDFMQFPESKCRQFDAFSHFSNRNFMKDTFHFRNFTKFRN